jgi:hypothetical protein
VISRKDAQTALAQTILEKIRQDPYPSYTQMTIFEETAPRELAQEYLEVLISKVEAEQWPSTTMLRRIQQVAAAL